MLLELLEWVWNANLHFSFSLKQKGRSTTRGRISKSSSSTLLSHFFRVKVKSFIIILWLIKTLSLMKEVYKKLKVIISSSIWSNQYHEADQGLKVLRKVKVIIILRMNLWRMFWGKWKWSYHPQADQYIIKLMKWSFSSSGWSIWSVWWRRCWRCGAAILHFSFS